jgi:uncharacterized Tic20 family protein
LFTHVEILFNFMWFGMIVLGAVITWFILKKRDPFDDGAGQNAYLDETSDPGDERAAE